MATSKVTVNARKTILHVPTHFFKKFHLMLLYVKEDIKFYYD